jgi:DNA-directed RNA polymerase specialized sigma24 family protein
VKPRFKTLKQAITLPQVIAYIDKCIEHGAGVAESEIEDIRQDILMKLYVLPEDLPLDSKRDKWKGYLSTVVKRHLIDRRRVKTGNDRLVFTKVDPDVYITPDTHSKRQGDAIVGAFFAADEADGLPPGSSLSESLNRLFRIAVMDVFRLEMIRLQDDSKFAYDIVTLRHQAFIADAATAHLTPEQAEKWRAVWRLYDSEDPPPSNREIARQVGVSDKWVAEVLKKRPAVEATFYERVAEQWKALDDRQKFERLRSMLAGYVDSAFAAAEEEMREADVERWRDLDKL